MEGGLTATDASDAFSVDEEHVEVATVVSAEERSFTDSSAEDETATEYLLEVYTYEDTCRLVTRLGIAALRYGLACQGVETWMQSLMQEFGYHGQFVATCQEIFCTFQRDVDDMYASQTAIVACKDGINLHKLALLSELAVNVKKKSLSPQQASSRLSQIDQDPTPWTQYQKATSFCMVGVGVAAVFGGSWLDVSLSCLCGLLVFGLTVTLESGNNNVRQWLPLLASFLCMSLASIAAAFWPQVNATLVTLSGVWCILPGYGVSLATQELVDGRKILSGVSRLTQSAGTLLWLLTGSALATRVTDTWMIPAAPSDTLHEAIPKGWLVLFVPLLFMSVSVVLNNSHRDLPWAVLCMLVAFLTSFVGGALMEANMGTFLGSTMMTIYANLWSNQMQRPNSIVLVPAYLMQASGSIGYFGLVSLVEGHTSIGTENILQMFLVALLITAGIFAGNTLVPSYQLM